MTLIVTLLLMGLATTLIGFLPGAAATWGVAAPLLILLRVVQGIARRRRVERLGAPVDGVGRPEAPRAYGQLAAAGRRHRADPGHRLA